jgi:ABC-type glutathione transport system ATPase component
MQQTEPYQPEQRENTHPGSIRGDVHEDEIAAPASKSEEQVLAQRQERQDEADGQAESLRKTEEESQISSEKKGEEPVIVIKGLRKAYGDHEVLRGVDMHVNKGENLVILGKSGTGKSVLIKCLVGLEWPFCSRIQRCMIR